MKEQLANTSAKFSLVYEKTATESRQSGQTTEKAVMKIKSLDYAPSRPLIWVEQDSTEYRVFIQRLTIDAEMVKINSRHQRNYLCIKCWGLLKAQHRKVHTEHKDFIITLNLDEVEAEFLELAKLYDKLLGSKVAIFNQKAEIRTDFNMTVLQASYDPTLDLPDIKG